MPHNIINGNAGNNTLNGTATHDTLNGFGGDDILRGRGNNDVLNGGDGNDRLNGGSGNDLLDGGDGNDTADYRTATAGVTVNLEGGGGQATGGAGIDTLVSIENFTGSKFNDTLISDGAEGSTFNGGTGNDYIEASRFFGILNGGAGNDRLIVGNGSGTLNGGTGNDHLTAFDGAVLNGGNGNDVLEAVAGVQNSILNGGAGADTLRGSGAAPNDIYDYNAVRDSRAGAGSDEIVNFVGHGADLGEQIDLRDIDAIPGGADNAFTYIGSAAFTAVGQLRYNTTTGILQGSTDGDTAAEFEIQLVGAPALVVGGAGTDILL